MHENIRPTAVAGSFYPREPATLLADVDAFLAAAEPARPEVPKAIVVPHAGYVYSGPIAGSAYATLARGRGRIRRVVLLGPAHRVPVRGLARASAQLLSTPLGALAVDERLDALVPWVPVSDVAHAEEHSLEVQLPFLLRVLGPEVTIAPFVVGDAAPSEVARVLEALWGGEETVVVISSDLSHYLPYAEARSVDQATADAIVALAPGPLGSARACGARAIDGLLEVARRRGLTASRLDLRTSGDTAGGRDEVVGYGAFAFYAAKDQPRESSPPGSARLAITQEQGRRLVELARSEVDLALGVRGAQSIVASEPWLDRPGATFVTLRRRDGELHGCIGSLEPRRSLGLDVRRNAVSALLEDPRAPSVDRDDAADLVVEVTVLGPLERIAASSRDELLGKLRPFEDGVVLAYQSHRGTFLPQVWASLPEPEAFLAHLERKAGLPVGFWSPELEAYRYAAQKFGEESGEGA